MTNGSLDVPTGRAFFDYCGIRLSGDHLDMAEQALDGLLRQRRREILEEAASLPDAMAADASRPAVMTAVLLTNVATAIRSLSDRTDQ